MTAPEDSGKGVIKVKLLRGSKVIRSYKVRSDTFTIGSAKGCTIRAAGDPGVAPKHATLYIEDGELMLVPERGAVVYLNGEEVDFAVPAPDDTIKIGRLNIQVELVESMDTIPPGRASKAPRASTPKARPAKRRSATMAGTPTMDPAELARQRTSSAELTQRDTAAPVGTPTSEQHTPDAGDGREPSQRVSAPPPSRRSPSIAPPTQKREQMRSAARAAAAPERPSRVTVAEAADTKAPQTQNAVVPKEQLAADEDDTQTVSPEKTLATAFEPGPGITGAISSFSETETEYYLSDDEEDEETFEEAFDLASMLLEGTHSPQTDKDAGPREKYCAAHVIRVCNGSVVDTFGVTPDTPYSTTYNDITCFIEHKKSKSESDVENIIVEAGRHVSGIVTLGGERQALNPSEGAGMVAMTFRDGDSAMLKGNGGEYKIEVYRPPLAPKKVPFMSMSPVMLAIVIAIALVLHGVAAYALRFFDVATLDDFLEEQEEVFAEVKVEVPEEKQIEEIIPEKEVVEEDAKSIAERAPKVSQRTVKKVKKQPETAVSNLLNILSKGSGKKGESNKLKDLISNIDAVKGPGAGSFSIAGAIASLPGNGVNIAKSGGGGVISTLSGDQVAGSGSGIASVGKVKKKGKVRGKVTKMSSGAKVGGSLSRADVLKVINSHFHAVQACYERALMQKPTLSGRIAFDWTVTKTGSVKGVRVRSSTLGSPKVANCIANLIKRWKFPRPKGGDAVITFPFLFRVGS